MWKILKEMGIPDHLTCLLRNAYAGQEAAVISGHGTTDWFQTGKGVRQGCILPPYSFNFYAEYIMRNDGLEEAQAEIKIQSSSVQLLSHVRVVSSRLLGEISVTSYMQMTPHLRQKVKKN